MSRAALLTLCLGKLGAISKYMKKTAVLCIDNEETHVCFVLLCAEGLLFCCVLLLLWDFSEQPT